MPYSTISDLPAEVRDKLTPDEQQQWLAVFNRVLEQTGDEEKAFMAAWGAVRKGRAARSVAIRRDGDQVIVKGWGMKFTGPEDPDAYDTFFSTLTNLLAEFYTNAPLWYEHGMDYDYGWQPIGRRHNAEIYGFGVWVEHELFPDHPLYERTLREIEAGELSYSSDSIEHYVEAGFNWANGEVRVWPLAGWSLTKQPAEPGLGPVTIDGLQAVITEMQGEPLKHYPLEGGRATLTLPAGLPIKSTILPEAPEGPADEPAGSEAREAQEDGEQARRSTDLSNNGERDMDPEMLASLAEFLGVEATPEAVAAALRDLIAMLESDAAESAPDAAPLRSALDLEADADDEAVVERLQGFLALIESEDQPEDEAVYDFGALRAARRRYDAVADHTPAHDRLPYQVPDEGDDDPYDDPPPARRNGGNGNARPGAFVPRRSRSIYRPNVNRGVERPGVAHAVLAALGQTPPGFRGPLPAIRARLFRLDRAARAQDSADGPRGAWVLNREIAADILEPLTAQLVLFEAGATRMPMDGIDSLTIRKQVGVPGAYWAAENTEIDGEDAEWAVASLMLKELRAPTSWPNRWLRNLAAGAEQMMRDQMIKAMKLKIEYSALFGSGAVPADGTSTGQEPLGVRNTPGVTVTNLGRTPEINDLNVAQGVLEDNNIEESGTWGWISHPRTFRTFEYMRDENGLPILRNSWAEGVRIRSLVDFPYQKTTGVPKNLGVGANESVLFLGDWQELVVGMGMDVELVVSEHVEIKQNNTFVMGIAYVDTAVMHSEAFHVHTGVLT